MEKRGKILTYGNAACRACSIAVLVLLLLGSATSLATPRYSVLEGIVIKVLDGDSLLLREGQTTHEVRLWGVDSPEYGQPYGSRARSLARSLVEHKQVRVVSHGRDQYRRLLGEVYVGGLCLNEELVVQGAAWVYGRYCREAICARWQAQEKAAREAGRGLWREGRPVPPWRWRWQH